MISAPYHHRLFLYSLLLILISLSNCTREIPLFERLSPQETGITFENTVEETELNNVLTNEYIYNGAGIGVADFNGNGYPDIFFAGNEVDNKLYLNNGNFQFQDVTAEAGITGNNRKWYSGVTIVDINNNGRPDIYISVTGKSEPELRRNELYINKGINENGIPIFEEMAARFGLDDPSYTTNAVFFDSNNNGLLDVYLLVAYSGSEMSYTNILAQRESDRYANTDKLLRAEWNDELGHLVYTDVSHEAGITKDGHGLGVQIVDINQNGFKDIYVANDYISEDLFWINRGDGTFIDMAAELFKHTSYSAMGTDIADLTNNGLPDIFTLDMLPETNIRRKMMANPNNYRNYINDAFAGFHPQYTRNTLQLNRGSIDENGLPIFSEVALLGNVAATDWSWAALLADFDNDGFRDIYVTNGIPRDVTDKDFWDEFGRVRNIMPMRIALPKIPEVKIPNYMFKNSGEIVFEDVTNLWGLDFPTYSTGAVYVDLNNNGALDLVVNNTNHPAEIYRNHLMERAEPYDNNWLKVKLIGSETNKNAIGAIVDLYFEDHHQRHENTPYRGYLSSVDPKLHFGLGTHTSADSLIITWPETDQKLKSVLVDIESNQTIRVDILDALPVETAPNFPMDTFFRDVTDVLGIRYRHLPSYVNDFHEQPTLPFKLSEIGPAVGVGDLSGNGLDDILIGSTSLKSAVIFYQRENGVFDKEQFKFESSVPFDEFNIADIVIFDANGNGLNDIYFASGGSEFPSGDSKYRDLFIENRGDGNFIYKENTLPDIRISSSVVRVNDFNGNGLPDLFVGGRLNPGRYPESVSSTLLINISNENGIQFTDATSETAPDLINIGNVNDAAWHDITGDGRNDLILAGDWMPITILQNNGSTLNNITSSTGMENYLGWWNRIHIADMNGNGLPDIIAGNLGLNSLYKATEAEPVNIYYGDLTDDGFFEAILTVYKNDADGDRKEYPAHNREDYVRMMPGIMSQFPTHREFGKATIKDLLAVLPAMPDVKRTNHFSSSIFVNMGDGLFEMHELPVEAQFSKILGIQTGDFTGNGFSDILLAGNLSGADLKSGSYNASNGLLIEGSQSGRFSEVNFSRSGFYLPGFIKNVKPFQSVTNGTIYVFPQYDGEIKMMKLKRASHP